MRRSSQHTGNSLQIALMFVVLVALLFLAGILIKFFLVFRASTFDGTHQYIVEVRDRESRDVLIEYNPAGKSVTLLQVKGVNIGKSSFALGIPIDASIIIPEISDSSKTTESMLFHGKSEKMTMLDTLRLLLFINTISPNNFHTVTLAMSDDEKTKEKVLSTIFFDQALYAENESIAIVNATGQLGFGSQIAHMLNLIGMNVVSVTTADKDQQQSSLTAVHDDSYTIKRMSRIFNITETKGNATISDITLTLGKESISQLE